jgi:hypothetical protein
MKKIWVITIIAVIVLALVLTIVLSRGWLRESIYRKSGERLAGSLSPELQAKYMTDLVYTLDKFWEFYEKGIVSQNDLTDVMDKMNYLTGKDTIRDRDIFDFISYVSRMYTDAMNRYHENHPYFQPQLEDTLRIELNQE